MGMETEEMKDPFTAAIEPWQMLGYLQGALSGGGTITVADWNAAIESQKTRPTP